VKGKVIYQFFALSALAVAAAACGSATPTEAPPAQPPEQPTAAAPTASADPTWDRVQTSGKIVFGTSADYQPFEYYDANYEIIGFDAALARELGARLGLQVELVDIAFEGLPAAVQIGQVDAAIAAMSVTPERQTVVDFTDVYFTGQDEILARDDSGIGPITTPAQLAQYRVGVQRGSVYASWIQGSLVDAGLMPEVYLLQYEKAGDAVRDLKEDRNDLVVLDALAADEYILAGGVVSVGRSLNQQLYAIALPKGATTLQAQLNAALIALRNDGTMSRLGEEYLEIEAAAPALSPTATTIPAPTATAIPGPTATPASCSDAMAFVSDVTVPDGTQMKPGQDFDKTWRIRNTGTCTWNTNYRLVFVQGDRMGGDPEAVKTSVRSGDTYDMTIDQKAPTTPGNYTGVWQMVNAAGTPFGQRLWVKITVPGAVAPTAAAPTATTVPPVQPTSPPGPVIDYLNADPSTVEQGGLVVVSWSFSGPDLASAKLTRTNPDGSKTPLNGGADVALQGQYEDLMVNPGTYSYTLNVGSEFGGTAVQTVVVNVTDG
jgi:ABC-type amino acid transport substrate-binding protein